MMQAIRKVCVMGAGVMGAGIAAQVANAGVPVLLLDIVPDGPADRDAVARTAVARMLKASPSPFMSKAAAKLIEIGNIEDHLERVSECDWVIEAIVERLDVKRSLYSRIEAAKRPGTVVSSNTSSIPLDHLVEGRSEQFKADFLITHFFNPPRYMRLVEIVRGKGTDPLVADRVERFIDRRMGKRLVPAKDTPGFIANRIGTYWLTVAINAAIDQGLTIEEADQIGGRPMGIPKTGIFGLIDLIGVDLMPLLAGSLSSTLPAGDPYHDVVRELPLVDRMIATGFTGRKGKGGFYAFDRETRVKRSLDLSTGEYRNAVNPAPLPKGAEDDLVELVASPGKVGAYAWEILSKVLTYAASLVGEAADDIVAIDDAMRLGYNWRYGPFELIDRIGAGFLASRLAGDGRAIPDIIATAGERPFYRTKDRRRQYLGADGAYLDLVRPDGVLLLEDVKLGSEPLARNPSAALWDIGDGVVVLEFTSKGNAIDEGIAVLMEEAIRVVEAGHRALVIYNEGANFSVGANLALALGAASNGAWDQIEALLAGGQAVCKSLKYAAFPVVAAPAGMALGGGCEVVLHADSVQAHAESYLGLVECGVGLLPGWGGNGELLDRMKSSPAMPRGPMPAVAKAFETISTAKVSGSAAEAREIGFLRVSDGVTMNRDRLLADAKAKALSLVEDYSPPEKPSFRLPGESGRLALGDAVVALRARGLATDYDVVVAGRLADVLTGGGAEIVDAVSEEDLLALERNGFMAGMRDDRTQARIRHMLETGKPLRN